MVTLLVSQTVAGMFLTVFQGVNLAMLTIYDKYWTSYTLIWLPVGHAILVALKALLIWASFQESTEYMILFGFNWVLSLFFVLCIMKLAKSSHYRVCVSDEEAR
jgi:hypothetical protein